MRDRERGRQKGVLLSSAFKSLHLHFLSFCLSSSVSKAAQYIEPGLVPESIVAPNILIPCRIAANHINMSASLRQNALHCDQTADYLPFLRVWVLVLSKRFDYVGFFYSLFEFLMSLCVKCGRHFHIGTNMHLFPCKDFDVLILEICWN